MWHRVVLQTSVSGSKKPALEIVFISETFETTVSLPGRSQLGKTEKYKILSKLDKLCERI
jgi:hypothetical protein